METLKTIMTSLGGATAICLIFWKVLGDIIRSKVENSFNLESNKIRMDFDERLQSRQQQFEMSFKQETDRIRMDFDERLQSKQHQNEISIEKIKKAYETQFDDLKASLQRYHESQFDVYRELWTSLCELKVIADELWISPTQEKVEEFGTKLRSAKEWLEKSAILIEENHYTSLSDLFQHFTEFFYGKTNLLELRNRQDIDENAKEQHRKTFIRENHDGYMRYNDILSDLKRFFREHIRGGYFKNHEFTIE